MQEAKGRSGEMLRLQRRNAWLRDIVLLLVTVPIATYISVWARQTNHPVTAANVFIVVVLISGSVGGLRAGLLSAAIVSFIYNFFVRFPVYSIGFEAIDDVVPVLALSLTAIASGWVSGQLRSKVKSTEETSAGLERLLEFSRRLHRARSLDSIAAELVRAIEDPDALDACLADIAAAYRFRDVERWEAAVARHLAQRGETGAGPQALLDRQAIVSLIIMAIERRELLVEDAQAEAAIRSEALKTALVSSLAHDLRTPLAAIAATATNLQDLGPSLAEEERQGMLATIREQCARLIDFSTKMLHLGRLDGGSLDQDIETVDLEEAIDSAVAVVRPMAAGRGIERSFETKTLFARANPLLLEQALVNLLENALHYAPADSSITVSLRQEGEQAVITIADSGPGIPEKDLPHVFERFFRGANGPGTPGHGLGLAIVQAFTQAIGASVQLRSRTEPPTGTEAIVRLDAFELTLEEFVEDYG